MTSVHGRRTVEVRPVQRGHLSKHSHREDYLSATDLNNAWSNMNEAKRVLHRAENRVDESTMPFSLHSTQGRRTRNKIRLSPRTVTPTQDPVTRLHEDHQPVMMYLDGEDFVTSRRSMMRRKYPQGRVPSHSGVYSPGGRHTSNPITSYSGKHYQHKSSRDILDQGSSNLSLDDSTNVRILNEVPHEETQNSARTREFTVEVSPGLKVNRDYIPAYRRLYGDTSHQGRTKHESLDRGDHGRQPQMSTEFHDRLRHRVESQRQRTNIGRTLNDEIHHKRTHKETDPVVYRPNGQPAYTDRGMLDNPPTRKVARAPPPPHYKGFNVPETKFMLPNGRVVSEDTLNSRTHRRKSKHNQESKTTKDVNPLQPSRTQTDNVQNKPTRKVNRKKASATRKQKQPDVKASVGAFAWREGAKVVREALGPSQVTKAKTGHSPTKDVDVRSQDSTSSPPTRERQHVDDDRDKRNSNNKAGGSKLPSDALEILEDLKLDSEQREDAEPEDPVDADLDVRQPLSFIVEPGQRKPPPRKAMGNHENEQTLASIAKVRHYDSREVRKYMVQQKNKRKKKQQELLEEKKEAENRKQKQLEEIYKKQKDNAKTARKDVTESKKDAKASNETFRKEPTIPPSQPVSAVLRRFPPRTQAMRKLDVTSSDKENKAFWSTTSSSDTSSRSSPQTDITGQPVEPHTSVALHPANREVTGGDIVLIPVTEEGAPIAVVGRQKMSSPEQDAGKASPPESSGHGKAFGPGGTLPPENGPQSDSDQRLLALKATAAALHSRLDSEVQKLANDLYSMLPTTMHQLPPNGTILENGHSGSSDQTGLIYHHLDSPSTRLARSLSPSHASWHDQLGSLDKDRWAFSVPSSAVKHTVRFQEDEEIQQRASPFQSRHQKTLAAQSPSPVFTGQLPGVGSMNQHASQAYEAKKQENAATKIQASYRGHIVRQKLKWAAPTLSSSAGEPKPERKRVTGEEDHLTLSEGALSDDAHVELEDDYLPKFQSLRASNHDHVVEPSTPPSKPSIATSPQSISNILRAPSAFQPTDDGLSVIDIFTRRYQQAQRSLLASRVTDNNVEHGKVHQSGQVPVLQSRRSPLPQTSSPGLSLKRPTTLDYSDDDFHTSSNRTPASVSAASRSGRMSQPQVASDASEPPYTPDFTDTSRSRLEGTNEKSESKIPDSESAQRSEDSRRSTMSPHSHPSSPGDTASISAVLPVKSPVTGTLPSQPKRAALSSPCSLPLSPTHEKPNSSRSPQSDPGHVEARRSPLGSNLYSTSDEEAPRSVRSRKKRGRRSPSARKSPMNPDTHRNFRPINSPVVPSISNQSPTVQGSPPPLIPSMVGYSPSALQLKMASELNLMDMLDASTQQVTDMEHLRTIALAQEESAALARILEGRQQDYERQLQLLSLKSRQEVEDAHRQLREVRETYAHEAMEMEKQQLKAEQDAAEFRRREADRLLQTQAEASRITAEAAKQLAEAHNALVKQPPPPPSVDASRLVAESTQAVAAAALEQQRLHQLDVLKEMKSGFKSPPPPRRSLGVGVNMKSSGSPNRSPTPHYTEDFTQSSQSSQSYTRTASTTQSKGQQPSKSERSIAEESVEYTSDGLPRTPPSRRSPSPVEEVTSDPQLVKSSGRTSHYTPRSVESENDSSIHTDSDAKVTINDTGSISEKLDDTKSVSDENSISFENSASEVDSVVDTSDRAPPQSRRPVGSPADNTKSPETRSATLPGQENSLSTTLHDSTLRTPVVPVGLRANLIKQELEQEDARAHQQLMLLELREKALVDKTQAELQWLEHQKRQAKNKRDEEALEALRRKQKNLYTKMTQEQEEIHRLKKVELLAKEKRAVMLKEQERITKLQQSTQQLMAKTRTMTPMTPHLTSFESHISGNSPDRSKMSLSSTLQDQNVQPANPSSVLSQELQTSPELSPADKQVRALQNVKLNARALSKRAVNLRKRRKEAEDLLAWKQKLDQEEEEVKKLEQQVKSKLKNKSGKLSEKSVSPSTPSSKSVQLTPGKDAQPSTNSEISEKLDSVSSGISDARTKSKSSAKVRSKSEKSVPEEVDGTATSASTVTEDIATEKSDSKSKKSPTRSPALNSSSEETVKDASQIADYASESFDSVDQTVTQVKSASLSPLRTTESVKSSPSPGLLSPNRRRQDPESGSESERSLSQTFSETASDQSDIEGRIRALTDSLKKRKIEADKLRKQQKRLYREKLKAQEASLKKQLEKYDSFIVQTRKELVKEKEAHPSPLAAGAKPQIKHLSISETQRKRDQSHTRALRQRTASESSVEGGVEIPKKRTHGFTENRRSSRSSAEDDNVPNKDVKDSVEGEKKKPSDPTSRSRSLSGDSSITEDLSLKSLEDVSISETSLSASLKTRDSIPEEKAEDSPVEKDRKGSLPDSSALSASTESEGRKDGADHKLSGSPLDKVTDAGDDRYSREDKPETSEIPEELSSMTSNASSLSVPATPGKTFDFGKKGEGDAEEGSKSTELSVKSNRDAASPLLGDDKGQQPQQSPRSHTSSVRTLSSKRSPRTDPSYSEDFQESSMSIHIKESKSDTEDDISEHLSDRSTASGESQVSERFVARQEDEPDQVQLASLVHAEELNLSSLSHQGETKELEDLQEVTVSPRIPEDRSDRESEDVAETEVDPLRNLPLGSRVEVGGRDIGVLRFKGPVKSRGQPLVGVELDQPNGNNDGTLDGVSYFLCAKDHGLFVSPDDVKETVPSLQGGLSAEEDLPSQSSIHTSSGTKEDDKSGLSMKFTEEFPAGENTDEAESIAEEISEGITDDAALQKVIISTAEAVESFSLDRDEPEGVESSPLDDTPRGPPEDNLLETNSVAKSETVEQVAEILIDEVVKESITISIDLLEKQEEGEKKEEENEEVKDESTRPKSSSFLELITEGASDATPPLSPIPAIPEKPVRFSKDVVVQREVEFVMNSLVQQTVDEMIKVRDERNKKWSRLEGKEKLSSEDAPELKTPEQVNSPAGAMKVSTPYTPDSEVPTPGDDLDSPLTDELFINRVTVQSAIMGIRDGDDTTPRARPTSPIFGESGSINPQALCDKLEQLQALDHDIFGADIFGGQEWFDDDFGTMPKSKSIIKVPRRAADDSMVPSRSPSPEEPLPKYNEARHVELKKVVEEPFMAVPHNKKDVSQIIDRAVKVVHETVEGGNPLEPLAPTAIIYGSDTIGNDIESTSKKAYKHLLFDLAKETYKTVQDEQEPIVQPPWMKPKRRPRKFLFTETPKTMAEMKTAVNVESLRILGLGQPPASETFSKYAIKKKRDKVDEILIQELREEEQEWVDYDDDELSVKMQLTDSIFTSLLTETAAVVARIQESRLSRERHKSQSDSDIEF